MTHVVRWLVAVLFVLLVGTANSGGYRFGASDQAFYVPAIALRADSTLFSRDRGVFEPQMRLWLGDEVLGGLVRATGVTLPTLFALLYALTMAMLVAAAVSLARSLGCDWWAIAACLVLLTLRHRIARTGANSLEGYMHPRMLAFACGLFALSFTARARPTLAVVWTLVAAVVHTSTALWFGGVTVVAAAWPLVVAHPRARYAAAGLLTVGLAALWLVAARMPTMDAEWLAVLGSRDYLFSADWPLYAWAGNLAYPVVLLAIYRRRAAMGVVARGEAGLVAGLLGLVGAFLVSIPLAERHVAFFVQLQANRVFWVLDGVTAVYVAWWLMADRARRWPPPQRLALIGALVVLAAGRGAYVLHETRRPLAQFTPQASGWTDVMQWLERQPSTWHVLADPGHTYKYGTSVRVLAHRDTFLESGKDPAMAIYDRRLAQRVAERTAAVASFDTWTGADVVRQLDAEYHFDVFVDRTDRHFDLPTLFRNDDFVVYDLR